MKTERYEALIYLANCVYRNTPVVLSLSPPSLSLFLSRPGEILHISSRCRAGEKFSEPWNKGCNYFADGLSVSLTGSSLMNQDNSAAGLEGADVQFMRTTSPTWYLERPPVICGPSLGRTETLPWPFLVLLSFPRIRSPLSYRRAFTARIHLSGFTSSRILLKITARANRQGVRKKLNSPSLYLHFVYCALFSCFFWISIPALIGDVYLDAITVFK